MKLDSKHLILNSALPLLALFGLYAVPARAEDFPEGTGKVIIMRACGVCHSTDQIARQKKSEEDWQATVVRMAGRGAAVTTDEVTTVVKYFAANFSKVLHSTKGNFHKPTPKHLISLASTDS